MNFKRQKLFSRILFSSAIAFSGLLAATPPAYGQFTGENIRADYGVNSGTQGPAGIYFIMPFTQQNADRLRGSNGDALLPGIFKGFDLRLTLPTVYGVTSKKILGGNYGYTVALPFTNFVPERASAQTGESHWGVSDLYVAPINLGWAKPRADFIVGYSFSAPTGKYTAGGDDNMGLGMWSHEVQGGTTIYLDKARKYTAATSAFLEFHTKKKDQDLKVGDILTLEGGAAYNIEKIGAAFGVGYAYQDKVTSDSGADLPVTALRLTNLYGKNHIFGIGPDISTGVFEHGRMVGLLNFRYLWESHAKSSFEGSTVFLSFTLARLAK